MKIQSLAVIFIIIILPIALVLEVYTQNRINTINLQTKYDSKLNDATYDAIKAYQLNSFNATDTSELANAKIRNIEASANTFFNSISSGFSELGYTKSTLQNYIPALVYTMYDGYYIYAPFTNTWDTDSKNDEIKNTMINQIGKQFTFKEGEKIYGLKPYVYYSCRYKRNGKFDVTITYSLDNYIQIQGTVTENDGTKKTVSKYGYLLDDVQYNENTKTVIYKNISIDVETNNVLKENVYLANSNITQEYSYIKKSGKKYYLDNSDNSVFSVIKGEKMPQKGFNTADIINNKNAQEYYKEAYELKKFMQEYELDQMTIKDIVDENGNSYEVKNDDSPYHIEGKIFDFNNIESETSNFNLHRIEVIKHAIERNLSIAISNFNAYSGLSFQMPKLKDTDWDKIMDNISMISFMQGINIGGKIYNGYAIVTNTKNEDVVMEDSIYIKTTDSVFHRVTENDLWKQNIEVGVYNVNLERRTVQKTEGNNTYYFPVTGTLSYDSIVTQNNSLKNSEKSIKEYVNNDLNNIDDKQKKLKKLYYTALARERYGIYRQQLKIN